MFCNQCEETLNNTGCTHAGICGKKGDVADEQDKLMYMVKRIARDGPDTQEANAFIMKSIFATVTNVNFDKEYFVKKIEEAKTYVDVSDEEIAAHASILLEKDEDARSLKELLTYGLKGLCAYLDHAYVLDYIDEDIFAFMREALVATLEHKTIDELTALIQKCGEYGVKTMALLDTANTEKYGSPEPTQVNIAVGSKPGILISGHDLKDMHMLLEQTKDTGVDVYTHGEMLPANSYPAFKKYDNFVGNYGGSWWAQKEEFEKFNGPILMTTNCLVPPNQTYKDKVYTTGVVGFEGLKHIPGTPTGQQKDFSALIEHAKNCAPPQQLEEGSIMGGFAHAAVLSQVDNIIAAVKSGAIKKFVVMGGCDGRQKDREYYTEFAKALPKDTIIMTAGCAKFRYNKLQLGDIQGIPRILDAGQCNDSYSLVVIAQKLAEAFALDDINKLPIAYNIAWYEQKAVLVLLALLSLGIKNIHLGPKLPAFVSPHVLSVLSTNYGIKLISTVDEDMKALI